MPVINIVSGKIAPEVKQELIKELTESASRIMNIPTRYFTLTINELEDENIGVGGESVSSLKQQADKNQGE